MATERFNRKLAAILATDVVGYSRLMAADEAGTLAALREHREQVIEPQIAAHHGRTVKLIRCNHRVEHDSGNCRGARHSGLRNAVIFE
jgi:adenylate cyclase